MHPRLTVLGTVFGVHCSVEEMLGASVRAGAERIGIPARNLVGPASEDWFVGVRASGLDVTHLLHGNLFHFEEHQDRQRDREAALVAMQAASQIGARCVYTTTGGASSLEWEDAAERFCKEADSLSKYAKLAGTPLLIEPTSLLFPDISFVHSLRDAVDLAELADIGVCLDIQHSWGERGLRQTIERAANRIGLVQMSDMVATKHVPFRAVPGDGTIPLHRIISWILETGYLGMFDVELYPESGVDPIDTVARAIDRAGELLTEVGV
jgi:sugar phosphate isomerase/epimerase